MPKDQGDVPHPNKKDNHYSERHQQVMSAYHRVITDRYNTSEEESNTNKLDKLHFTKLKTSINIVTM